MDSSYVDFCFFEEEERGSVARRLEEEPGLRDVLQAERRALAAFSSDIAELMVLRSASAIWDILFYVRQELVEERRVRYLRRLAAWRALTRPIAAIMETLFRPAVRSRRRSWTSFWVAIVGLTLGEMEC